MPAKKYQSKEDRPIFLLGRLPAYIVAQMHAIVRAKHPDFRFPTLASLNDVAAAQFIAANSWKKKGFSWLRPKAVATGRDDVSPSDFSQHRFQFSPEIAKAIAKCHGEVEQNQSVFLYTAISWYLEQPHVAAMLATHAPAQITISVPTGIKDNMASLIRIAHERVREAQFLMAARQSALSELLSLNEENRASEPALEDLSAT
jgi:hypothetical protein